MIKQKVIWIVFLVLIMSCTGRHDITEKRAHRAAHAKGNITIGVVWPLSVRKDMFSEGIKMAVNEVNAAGGVLGRKMRVILKDDEASVSKGRLIAQQFAENTDIVAVIGHCNSYISIPTSATYEYAGLLMLSPGSTNPKLTRQGFKHVFRNIPTDEEIGKQMAEFANRKGYKQMMIYYVKDAYGRGLANSFEDRADELGIKIVDRLSYEAASLKDFKRVLTNWKDIDFDAIFLAAMMPESAVFIAQAWEQNVRVPILGGDGLDSPDLWKIGGKGAEGTVVASAFHPDDPRLEVQHFNTMFQKKYGVRPDAWAAQGYDAVKLLAYVMEKAKTTIPDKVAEALHSTKDWPGVTGLHTFNDNGDVVGKTIVKMIVRNGKFEYLAESHAKK